MTLPSATRVRLSQSPSSNPSHHYKVVNETPSSSKVTEEYITEQPIKPKTSAANILNEALQDHVRVDIRDLPPP
jgi:hypothetical protein